MSDRPELREFFVCQLDDIRDVSILIIFSNGLHLILVLIFAQSAREQWDNVYRKIRENRRSNDN